MTSRLVRIAALALPFLLAVVLVSSGGWRIHDGRVERVSHDSSTAAPSLVQPQQPAPQPAPHVDQVTMVRHLSPSIPWQAWASLIVLCLLPATASVLMWSGARRGRDATFSSPGGAP